MLAAVDVHYFPDGARAACLTFEGWDDSEPLGEHVAWLDTVEDYRPGQFWRRELPCLLEVLSRLAEPPSVLVIDGYVHLDPQGSPGLGAHLFDALGGIVAIFGVAKTKFRRATQAREVLRHDSLRPLYVTSIGADIESAASAVHRMAGPYRIPTLLKRVDQLARVGHPLRPAPK